MEILTGNRFEATVGKLALGGDGVARLPGDGGPEAGSGLVAFVPYSAPGDRLEVEITERKKTFARGKIVSVLSPGPERASPPCPYYFAPSKTAWCGGCNFQHLVRRAQSEHKSGILRETIAKIARIPDPPVQETLSPPEGREWRYRNKMQVPFGLDPDKGVAAAGFYSPGSHRIVSFEDCLIHPERMSEIVRSVLSNLREWGLTPYSEKLHAGWLRHLLLRRSESAGKILAVFVTLDASFPKKDDWLRLFQSDFPEVAGLLQNVNPDRTNVILGKKWKKISGEDHLIEEIEGLGPGGGALKLKVSAGSFFQVNAFMAAKLYGAVRELLHAGEKTDGTLLDLYSGVGGIALACAPAFARVVGAEESESSVSDASGNAGLNGIVNCEFVHSDAGEFLKKVPRGAGPPVSAAVLDPPRSGCPGPVLQGLAALGPKKIVYVSCDPGTLARDAGILSAKGYRLSSVRPVDLFPQSSHIESVSLLEKAC